MQLLQKYKSIIKKKKKKLDEKEFLEKTNLDSIKVLISKALIHSYIDHDKFISVNIVLREYNEIKRKNQKS